MKDWDSVECLALNCQFMKKMVGQNKMEMTAKSIVFREDQHELKLLTK